MSIQSKTILILIISGIIDVEDLKKLIALQTGIQDILVETEKMYNNLNQTLDLFLSFIGSLAYLLVALQIFILIHRITTRIDEIKKGWQLLTS